MLALFVGGAQSCAADLIQSPWERPVHAGYCLVFTLLQTRGFAWPHVWIVVRALLVSAADEAHQLLLPAR